MAAPQEYFYAVSYDPSKWAPAITAPQWPNWSMWVTTSDRRPIQPLTRWPALFANGNATIVPSNPVLYLNGGSQNVVLTTVGTPAPPTTRDDFPNYVFQLSAANSPPGFTLITQQYYAVANYGSNAATMTGDLAGVTVNGSASFSQPANTLFIYVFDQNAPGNFTATQASVIPISSINFGP